MVIKSVAQAIPNYSMSSFDIPNKICDNLDALSRRFCRFGGDPKRRRAGTQLGMTGISYVNLKLEAGWGLEKQRTSIMLC